METVARTVHKYVCMVSVVADDMVELYPRHGLVLGGNWPGSQANETLRVCTFNLTKPMSSEYIWVVIGAQAAPEFLNLE
jgi:hypothetical protein